MFKFFRKYEKVLLVVGGSILMISFLIQPFISLFTSDPGKQPVGEVGGEIIRMRDLHQAGAELELIQSIIGARPVRDPLQWVLMKHEARKLGLSASEQEAKDIIEQELKSDVKTVSRRLNMSQDRVLAALRDLSMMNRYIQVMGLRGAYQPEPHLSRPLLEHYISDVDAKVSISAVAVSSTTYLDRITPPTQEELQTLFDQHKDTLPGESKPYGFGYRYPDRFQIEYLEIEADDLAEKVKVTEAEALAYYEAHQEELRPRTAPGAPPGDVPTYEEVRTRILEGLRRQAADTQAREMLKSAQSLLGAHERNLTTDAQGYREIGADWQPLSYEDLAQRLQEKFGILPTYDRLPGWHNRENLPLGLGESWLLDQPDVSFEQYAFIAREFNHPVEDRFKTLRLQRGITGEPLRSYLGSYYLFRLTEIEPAHSPASLDEVRTQVESDTRRLAAYQLLRQDLDHWRKRAQSEPFDMLALELHTDVLKPPAFGRREQDGYTGKVSLSDVPGIGQDEAFVTGVFDLVQSLPDPTNAEQAPFAQRADAFAVDPELSVILVRVDGYTLPPHNRLDALSYADIMGLNAWLAGADNAQNPLDIDILKRRLGFVEEKQESDTSETSSAEKERQASSN